MVGLCTYAQHTGIVPVTILHPSAMSHQSKQMNMFSSPNIIPTTFSDSTKMIIFYEQPQYRALAGLKTARVIFPRRHYATDTNAYVCSMAASNDMSS